MSERRGSSVELATMGGERKVEVGAHVEVVGGEREREREIVLNKEGARKGSVTTVIDGGLNNKRRNSSRNNMR